MMKTAVAAVLTTTACIQIQPKTDRPPPSSGDGVIQIDSVTDKVTLDSTRVPVLPACSASQFVRRTSDGSAWECAAPVLGDLAAGVDVTDTRVSLTGAVPVVAQCAGGKFVQKKADGSGWQCADAIVGIPDDKRVPVFESGCPAGTLVAKTASGWTCSAPGTGLSLRGDGTLDATAPTWPAISSTVQSGDPWPGTIPASRVTGFSQNISVANGGGLSGDGSAPAPLRVATDGVTASMLARDALSLPKISRDALSTDLGGVPQIDIGRGGASAGYQYGANINAFGNLRVGNVGALAESRVVPSPLGGATIPAGQPSLTVYANNTYSMILFNNTADANKVDDFSGFAIVRENHNSNGALTGMLADKKLGQVGFYGSDGHKQDDATTYRASVVEANSRGNWLTTSHPSSLDFYTTATNETDPRRALQIDPAGEMFLDRGGLTFLTASAGNISARGPVKIAAGNGSTVPDSSASQFVVENTQVTSNQPFVVTSGNITMPYGGGLTLRDDTGSGCHRLVVSASGGLSTVAVSCSSR